MLIDWSAFWHDVGTSSWPYLYILHAGYRLASSVYLISDDIGTGTDRVREVIIQQAGIPGGQFDKPNSLYSL